MLDTKGPEIRIGTFNTEEVELKDGDIFTLTTENIVGDKTKVHISYEGLVKDVKTGDKILIDDGLIELAVEEIIDDKDIKCRVINGGSLKDHKGVNVPNVSINLPPL